MNFYIDFLYIHLSFLIIYLPMTRTVSNKNLNVIKSGQAPVNPCSIGISFFTLLNNTSESDYFVELLPDECCIDVDGTLDCDSLKIIGECVDILPKGKMTYLSLVAPTVDPLERKGFCTIHVDSRPVDRKNNVMRDTIKIKFDTSIKNIDNLKTIAPCTHIDEDPLNECKPVNCEHYYNGVKNFFDQRKKKCVDARLCNEDERYDVKDNECKRSDSITETDLNFLKSLVVHGRPHKDVLIIKTIHCPPKPNCTNVCGKEEEDDNRDKNKEHNKEDKNKDDNREDKNKEHNKEDKNKEHKTEKPKCKEKTVNATKIKVKVTVNDTCESSNVPKADSIWKKMKLLFRKFISIVKNNKYTIFVLVLVVILQCAMLIAMMYYMKCCKKCCPKKNKKVKCKFFNYRQDASITTPLICTSNIDTETTEFNYVSESSYIDKKIKCYKACQKQPADAKISMSDDILTKYLNRRDWNTKINSETAQNIKHINLKTDSKGELKVHRKDESKVHRKDEFKVDRKDTNKPSAAKKETKVDKRSARTRDRDAESYRSERELQCHDYNFNIDQSKRFIKKTASLSTEKGAQACFSNDSVDDFLSEKGILLFGDNISKYSLNTSSPARSSYTDTSSKTSKNNILRHFISFLSRKSKMAVNSDPGKASKDKLELLHMSKASLQSTSDSNMNKLRSSKYFKESRSTF